MLNMIRMEIFRMFKTRSLYVIWLILFVGIIFTTSLSAAEMKEYTMEEKQEMYEYAMGQQAEDEPTNFGMDVTTPTKPGEDVSVFDLFYANIKGKFVALFMVIFAILFSTADTTSGYIKNIAGQVRDRKGLVAAKAVALFLYTILTLLLFAAIQIISNGLFFQKMVLGNLRTFAIYGSLQILLHFALLMTVMCIAMILRNNVITMTVGTLLCMNVLTIFYGFIDKKIAEMGVEDFHLMNYTVTGRITLLNMGLDKESVLISLAVAAGFVLVTLALNSIVFQKRDI